MKHALRTALGAGFLLASWAAMGQVAEAGTLTMTHHSSYQSGVRGEFQVTSFQSGGVDVAVPAMGPGVFLGGVFQTFCLERNEDLDFEPAVMDWEYNTGAVKGGNGGQDPAGGDFDPLDPRTAYLYSQFWNGTLSGYDYTPGKTRRAVSASALQLAIWYLENELRPGSNIEAEYFANAQATGWVDEANDWLDAHPGAGIGHVRVLNLTRDDRHGLQHQDVLVLSVPLPSAALLGLGLMSGVGAFELIRRRRRTFA